MGHSRQLIDQFGVFRQSDQATNALWDLFAIELDWPLCVFALEGEKAGIVRTAARC